MASDSNTGSGHGFDPSSHFNYRMLSFQNDVVNSATECASSVMCSSSGNPHTIGSFSSGSPDVFGNSSAAFGGGGSFGSGQREWVRGLKHNSGLAVDWTYEEQNLLSEGLIRCAFGYPLCRYASEGHIMKYIKIAALFPNKSVRDVALRIRWLVKHELAKCHKLEEHYVGRRIRERKEKMIRSFSSRNVHGVPPNNTSFPPLVQHSGSGIGFPCKVSTLDGSKQQLMDENDQLLLRIAANLELFKLQDNIDLFCHTRNNILSILKSMSSMPGIMSQMPPLPISVNDELLYSIFPRTAQAQTQMFASHGGFDVKQELNGSHLL
ncbi:hypothetical protein HPP92_002232 [Vanilla planifolia]|uniref:Uncharacterized protein n=1 Tax=Vanilla planifolia TaxID=51239 RepID=A0A835S0V5_VANPL|nr:hypothetical protein HPP92_002232 [Vanilla planifolia]